MDETEEIRQLIDRNRTAKARRLVAALDDLHADQGLNESEFRSATLATARRMSASAWEYLAIQENTPPSDETIARVINMLEQRLAADNTFHRRTHGNFR